jgi:hypothetical protein
MSKLFKGIVGSVAGLGLIGAFATAQTHYTAPLSPAASPRTNVLGTATATPSTTPTATPTPTASPAPVPIQVSTPVPTAVPTADPTSGATALCVDGTLSYSANHSGTCSHHGGVSEWYK